MAWRAVRFEDVVSVNLPNLLQFCNYLRSLKVFFLSFLSQAWLLLLYIYLYCQKHISMIPEPFSTHSSLPGSILRGSIPAPEYVTDLDCFVNPPRNLAISAFDSSSMRATEPSHMALRMRIPSQCSTV